MQYAHITRKKISRHVRTGQNFEQGTAKIDQSKCFICQVGLLQFLSLAEVALQIDFESELSHSRVSKLDHNLK